jgi:hypothetical protein
LDRTSFVCNHEPIPAEPEVHQEEAPVIKSEPLESQSVDSTSKPSPKLKPARERGPSTPGVSSKFRG